MNYLWDFPGGLMAKTLSSECRGPGFDPFQGYEAIPPKLLICSKEPMSFTKGFLIFLKKF